MAMAMARQTAMMTIMTMATTATARRSRGGGMVDGDDSAYDDDGDNAPFAPIVIWKSQNGAKTLVILGAGKKLKCFDPLRKGCRDFFNFF